VCVCVCACVCYYGTVMIIMEQATTMANNQK
jgi:hypothetical protein